MMYSLEHAFKVLRESHAARLKDPLWPVDLPDGTKKQAQGDLKDDWYTAMSEYLHTRQGATQWGFAPSSVPRSLWT